MLLAAALAADVTVTVEGLRNDKGSVIALLFQGSKGFPDRPDHAHLQQTAPVNTGKCELTFTGLAEGTYAVAVVHDENGNGRLDSTWYGAPKEGVAASNGAKGQLGPPSFADASFSLVATGVRQVLRVDYYSVP